MILSVKYVRKPTRGQMPLKKGKKEKHGIAEVSQPETKQS